MVSERYRCGDDLAGGQGGSLAPCRLPSEWEMTKMNIEADEEAGLITRIRARYVLGREFGRLGRMRALFEAIKASLKAAP